MTYLVTTSDLAGKSATELSALHRCFTDALARSDPGSDERRNALASLENIARARATISIAERTP